MSQCNSGGLLGALCIGISYELVILVGFHPIQLQPEEEFNEGTWSIRVNERKTIHNSSFCDIGLLWDKSNRSGFCEELVGSVGDRSHTLD
jgi:hypothetical protein